MNFDHIQLKMSPLFGGYGWLDLGKIWSKVESELVTCINMFQASMGMGWKQKWIDRGNPCGPTLRLCFFSFSQSGIPKTPMPGQYQIIIDRVESYHNWYIYIYILYTNYHSPALLSSNIFSDRYVPLPLSRGNAANPCTCQLCLWRGWVDLGLIKCLAFDGRIWWKYDGNLMAESDGNDIGLSNNITM